MTSNEFDLLLALVIELLKEGKTEKVLELLEEARTKGKVKEQ